MKPFNLKEYLKDPSKEVITRDGRAARIICTDMMDDYYPVVALYQLEDPEKGLVEIVESYTKDGKASLVVKSELGCDLFFAPEKKEGWINIFFKGASNDNRYVGYARIFKSKEDAEKEGEGYSNYITTLKIEWEE